MNVCRLVLAATFIFSGYVKAIDPLGTQYKLHDYAQAAGVASLAPDWLTLGGSVELSAWLPSRIASIAVGASTVRVPRPLSKLSV